MWFIQTNARDSLTLNFVDHIIDLHKCICAEQMSTHLCTNSLLREGCVGVFYDIPWEWRRSKKSALLNGNKTILFLIIVTCYKSLLISKLHCNIHLYSSSRFSCRPKTRQTIRWPKKQLIIRHSTISRIASTSDLNTPQLKLESCHLYPLNDFRSLGVEPCLVARTLRSCYMIMLYHSRQNILTISI